MPGHVYARSTGNAPATVQGAGSALRLPATVQGDAQPGANRDNFGVGQGDLRGFGAVEDVADERGGDFIRVRWWLPVQRAATEGCAAHDLPDGATADGYVALTNLVPGPAGAFGQVEPVSTGVVGQPLVDGRPRGLRQPRQVELVHQTADGLGQRRCRWRCRSRLGWRVAAAVPEQVLRGTEIRLLQACQRAGV